LECCRLDFIEQELGYENSSFFNTEIEKSEQKDRVKLKILFGIEG
jgi:hypothetical protein